MNHDVEPELAGLVGAEVQRAIKKFPTWPTDPLHAVAVLGEEFGELTKAALQLTYEPHKTSMEEFRKEAIQTAAMALRFVHSLDIYRFRRCEQHTQGTALLAWKVPDGMVLVPREVVQAAARKLHLIGTIYHGDKESRRLAVELQKAAAPSCEEGAP